MSGNLFDSLSARLLSGMQDKSIHAQRAKAGAWLHGPDANVPSPVVAADDPAARALSPVTGVEAEATLLELAGFLTAASGDALFMAPDEARIPKRIGELVPRLAIQACVPTAESSAALQGAGITERAIEVCPAWDTPFQSGYCNVTISIGYLHRLTQDQAKSVLRECARIGNVASYHWVAVAAADTDEGWYKTTPCFRNDSLAWWRGAFQEAFPRVLCIPVAWQTPLCRGAWFIGSK